MQNVSGVIMKANLEYTLPEDQEQFNIASKSMDWALLVWDLDQFMRNKIKYGPRTHATHAELLEELRDRLNFQMEEKGLQFPA